MNKKKPIAGISLDLDNQWSYMKIHGDEGFRMAESKYEVGKVNDQLLSAMGIPTTDTPRRAGSNEKGAES